MERREGEAEEIGDKATGRARGRPDLERHREGGTGEPGTIRGVWRGKGNEGEGETRRNEARRGT